MEIRKRITTGIPENTFEKELQRELQSFSQELWEILTNGLLPKAIIGDGTNNVTISAAGVITFNGSGAVVLPTYTNATRPAATTAGMLIFNSDDNAPNVADGTNWRDMAGDVT